MFHSNWQKNICVPRLVKCAVDETVEQVEPVETPCTCPDRYQGRGFFLSTTEFTVTAPGTNTASFSMCRDGFDLVKNLEIRIVADPQSTDGIVTSFRMLADGNTEISFTANMALYKACVSIFLPVA